jgi:signal transduction histidine kinase
VRLADISILTAAMRQREQALQLLTHDMRSPQTSILAMLATTPDLPPELSDRLAAYARAPWPWPTASCSWPGPR